MKQKLCIKIYEFFKDKCDKISETPKYFEFKNWEDMLTQIKNNFNIALWAITEIPYWYMPDEYFESIKAGYDENDDLVYKVDDIYFITTQYCNDAIFVKPVTKLVEVKTWEKIN